MQCEKCNAHLPESWGDKPCICGGRKFKTPRVCKHLGESTDTVLKVRCGSSKLLSKKAWKCGLHNRCIPGWKGPWQDDQATEASIYAICKLCEDQTES